MFLGDEVLARLRYKSAVLTIVQGLGKRLRIKPCPQKSVRKWLQEESCTVEASMLGAPVQDNAQHSAAMRSHFDNALLLKHGIDVLD